jgi:uncharacterized protein
MQSFHPPPFDPHPIFRGGHLQTIIAPRPSPVELHPTVHHVGVSDGDQIVLHQDTPAGWIPGQGGAAMLLIHGISGCHAAPYMIRLADHFLRQGICVYRMDMRGCGAAFALTKNLTHAGRSDDVLAALQTIAQQVSSGPIAAIGVSLGANQLLRAVGRVGAGLDPTPAWFGRLKKLAIVAPPLDLQRCSENLERWILRPYNRYFIRSLLSRVPSGVYQRDDFQKRISLGRPKTLRELDDRITGPLSGFADARDYYARTSAGQVANHNPIPSLVLTAADDPLIPLGCFLDDPKLWPSSTKLLVTKTGGHVGFLEQGRSSWLDRVMNAWFDDLTS